MGFKWLMAILLSLIVFAAYGVGASDKVSEYIEKYTAEKLKDNPEKQEKFEFFNIQYMDFTAKYTRAIELLDKYKLKYPKEREQAKAQFLLAKILEHSLQTKAARAAYDKYIQDFPDGEKIEQAKQKYTELKNFY